MANTGDKIRILVAGSRDIVSFRSVARKIARYLKDMRLSPRDVIFISGRARNGPDDFIYHIAKRVLKVELAEYPADWDRYGKSAGYKRNIEMLNNADVALFFHDGVSNGTNQGIEYAEDHGAELNLTYETYIMPAGEVPYKIF